MMARRMGMNPWRALFAACAALVLALGCALPVLAADLDELEKSLTPGDDALARVLPELDALAGPMSRDVLDGKADIHVFYGIAVARILYEHCRDTISLMRAAKAQQCPALEAALVKQLGDAASRLEGAATLIAGSLPMTANPRVGILGHATVEALRLYLGPLKAFTAVAGRREL